MIERKHSTVDLTLPGQGDHIRIVPPNIPSSFTDPLEKVGLRRPQGSYIMAVS